MKSFAVRTFGQLGDTVILAGAVHNVRLEHPEFNFTFLGKPQYAQLLENNDDFSDHSFSRLLPLIRYGDVHDERNATKGTCVEGFTATLCDVLNIPHVPIRENRPRVLLSDSEREWAGQWNDCILINANCQTCSMSKAYPYWQEVVDGLGDYRIIQVGGKENRDISHDLRGVEDMRGRTTMREFVSMVYGCRAVISAPSGITNVASAFRKPQVFVWMGRGKWMRAFMVRQSRCTHVQRPSGNQRSGVQPMPVRNTSRRDYRSLSEKYIITKILTVNSSIQKEKHYGY